MNLAYTLYRTARRLPRAIAVIERDRIELDYQHLAGRVLALAGRIAFARRQYRRPRRHADEELRAVRRTAVRVLDDRRLRDPINIRRHPRESGVHLDDAGARACSSLPTMRTDVDRLGRSAAATQFIDVDRGDDRKLLAQCGRDAEGGVSRHEAAWRF